MPVFEYTCPENHTIEVRRPYSSAGTQWICFDHGLPCARVWSVPITHVSKEYAVDIMNEWTAGRGKPMAGKTIQETQAAALAMAKSQHEMKQYAKVPDFVSFPNKPPTRNYTSD